MELEKNQKTRKLLQNLLKLEDKVVGMPFPKMKRMKQISSYHCGPAVISELFSFVGKNVSQKAIVKVIRAEIKIKKFGLNMHDLARAAKMIGKKEYVFWRKQKATITNISTVINKHKYPVGVEWQGVFYENSDEDNGHYAVVTKIDGEKDYLRIYDSYPEFSGVDRRFKIKEFKKRWWDVNRIHGRNLIDKNMMFVITPKGEKWPSKIGMVRA